MLDPIGEKIDGEMSDVEMIVSDNSGHTVLRWNTRDNQKILDAIQTLMGKGHHFFLVEYSNLGAATVEREINSIEELTSRSVVVQEETLKQMYADGTLKVVSGAWATAISILRGLKSPEDVKTIITAPREPGPTRQSIMYYLPRGGG